MSKPISPAIIINEHFDAQPSIPTGYHVLVTGFTSQGVANEPYVLSRIGDFVALFGEPSASNPEQLYAYESVKRVIDSGAVPIFIKLPYGTNAGEGSGEEYSILRYSGLNAVDGGGGNMAQIDAPKRVVLNEDTYQDLISGNFEWGVLGDAIITENLDASPATNTDLDDIFGSSSLIIADSGKTTTNDGKGGYYVTVIGNSDADPAEDWTSIDAIYSKSDNTEEFANDVLSTSDYNFKLTSLKTDVVPSLTSAAHALAANEVSEPWENSRYDNYVSITLWRLSPDVKNGQEVLSAVAVETYTGSLSESETEIGEGGVPKNVFIEDVINGKSSRLKVLVHPQVKQLDYTDGAGTKNGLVDAKAPDLYSISRYQPLYGSSNKKVIGDVPKKLVNALCTVDNPDRIDIDLSVEAGLGTVYTMTEISGNDYFDDKVFYDMTTALGRGGVDSDDVKAKWVKVFDTFHDFTSKTRVFNGGNQHLHIADPLRHIFVNGGDCKVYDTKTKCKNAAVFSESIYHPLKTLTTGVNTTVATIDAQWYKVNNLYSHNPVWVPSSAVTAKLMAETEYPWQSAAGVSRGLVDGVVDIAVDPVQRDRDLLWKIHNNAVFYDRFSDSFLRFADQTLLKNDNIQLRQNSARRLMIWLEKNLRHSLKPFLHEPNNLQTRIRFKNRIELYLKTLLNNGAIEDFAVSLSKNTPTQQQEGNLIADIAIKITGQVDRIILNFDILRLDQPFREVY